MDDNIRVAESHMSDKGYELSTHEKQQEFARKRMQTEDDYVLKILEKEYNSLWKLTESNMNLGLMNIMDDIRLEKMDKIKEAIDLLRKRK